MASMNGMRGTKRNDNQPNSLFNSLKHGKGRSIKASDLYVASLCFRCHGEIDQGSYLSKEERLSIWTAAHERTVKELNRLGLWPKNVPQP
jgi:hypothetical protein